VSPRSPPLPTQQKDEYLPTFCNRIEEYLKAATARVEWIVEDLGGLDDKIILLALHYLDRLFPDGAYVPSQYHFGPAQWSLILGRIFGVGVLLAEKWLDDEHHYQWSL